VAAPPSPRAFKLTKLSEVQARPIRWLLPGRIPYGAVTVLAGRPGEGKSQFTIAAASALSQTGTASIIVGAEDGLADMVRPRAMAADADLDLIQALTIQDMGIESEAGLPGDVPLLERAVKETGAGLVVFDPVMGHIDPEINTHSDQSLRLALAPLARMARSTGVAVVFVAHLNKGGEGTALNRIGGGIAMGGVARSVLFFGRHKKDDPFLHGHRRYLTHEKCNGARLAPALECMVESITVRDGTVEIPTSHVLIEGEDRDVSSADIA
jgi:hypothetical protein